MRLVIAAVGIVAARVEAFSAAQEPSILFNAERRFPRADSSGPDRNHFGDILRGDVQVDLQLVDDRFNAVERTLLTSNCNTARLLSAYHNRQVGVTVLKNERIQPALFERQCLLSIGLTPCCLASTVVTATTPAAAALLDDADTSILDAFDRLKELPTFRLVSVARDDANISRTFTLSTSQLACQIEEVFPAAIFDDDFLSDDS